MVDNFEQISRLLSFDSDDEFYFLQILQRKKENKVGGTKNHNRLLRYHVITSVEKLMSLKEELVQFAEYFNARVCINLNKRSFEKVAFKSLKNMSDAIVDKDFRRAKHAWISACGQAGAVGQKRWIVDVDEKGRQANDMILFIERQCRPEGNKYIATIPSKNGYHIITTPFDLKYFSWFYPGTEIHKNNPSNIYIP